jgi:hypothetical protein
VEKQLGMRLKVNPQNAAAGSYYSSRKILAIEVDNNN